MVVYCIKFISYLIFSVGRIGGTSTGITSDWYNNGTGKWAINLGDRDTRGWSAIQISSKNGSSVGKSERIVL